MRFKQALIVILAVWISTLSLTAQEQEEPQATIEERLEVTEVLLDVVVTDGTGNIIIGLQPGDFLIRDGEREISAKTATFYSNRQFVQSGVSAQSLGVSPEDIVADRYFILFLHDQRFEDPDLTANILDAIRWAKNWVRYESLANDWIAILSYDATLKVHQDFTNNKEALLKGLDSAAKSANPGSTWPSRIEEAAGPSLRVNLPQGKDLRKQTRRIYSALDVVAEAAGPIVGRKNLLLFSVGLGQARTNLNYAPDVRYWPGMMESLNDNNVAVYAISWIKNAALETEEQVGLSNSLTALSADTGGRYFGNFVNFKEPLQMINEDNNGYYLVSYDAEYPAGTEGFREVQVSVQNPNFNVRARKGYKFGE